MAAILLWTTVLGAAGAAAQQTQLLAVRTALLVDLTGVIGPASVHHLQSALREAETRSLPVLIVRINTPGGLATSTRELVGTILAARVPVVGYVAPAGAHAASAGTYVMYATHVAAMAPGTNLGAATPVQIGGSPAAPSPAQRGQKPGRVEPPSDASATKAINDSAAFLRGLAELRGRNPEWAEKAVREAASLSTSEALKSRVIDLVAADLPELLTALDGRSVDLDGRVVVLSTRGLTVEHYEPSLLTRVLGVIANPNVALILLLIGIYGLIFELATPGSFGPGAVGAVCLLLGLYALNQLPVNYTGLSLVLVGIVCMIAEAFTPTFGILGAVGLGAFILGAGMLIDTDLPQFQLSGWVIGATALVSVLMLSLLLGYVWRVHRRPVIGGERGLVGNNAEVIEWRGDRGHVWTHGERWQARADRPLRAGERVTITAVDGLTLVVSPLRGTGGPHGPSQHGA